MIIETARLRLRPLYEYEIADFTALANDYQMADMIGINFPYPYTLADAQKHQKKLIERHNTPAPKSFIIALRASDRVIGAGGLDGANDYNDTPSIGYWLGRAYRGQGYAVEAVRAFMQLGFITYSYDAVSVDVATDNQASIKTALKCGLRAIAVYEDAVPSNHRGWRTHQHFAITKAEWEKLRHA